MGPVRPALPPALHGHPHRPGRGRGLPRGPSRRPGADARRPVHPQLPLDGHRRAAATSAPPATACWRGPACGRPCFAPGDGPAARDALRQPDRRVRLRRPGRDQRLRPHPARPGAWPPTPRCAASADPPGTTPAPSPCSRPSSTWAGARSPARWCRPAPSWRSTAAAPGCSPASGVASPGDSGSPVVGPDGRAVGVLVATGPAIPLVPTGLFVFSVRIAPEMGRAGAAMGLGFDLVTASLRARPLPYLSHGRPVPWWACPRCGWSSSAAGRPGTRPPPPPPASAPGSP